MKEIFAVILTWLSGILGFNYTPTIEAEDHTSNVLNERVEHITNDYFVAPPPRITVSGNYLASEFAQRRHDWEKASALITPLVVKSPQSSDLVNKAMILAMGSGQAQKAVDIARNAIGSKNSEVNSLSSLFLITEAFKNKDYEQAETRINEMPRDHLSDFILPLLQSWKNAAQNEYDVENLRGNTIHIQHAIFISDFLNKKMQIEPLLSEALQTPGLSLADLENLADAYAHIGQKDTALSLYEQMQSSWPQNKEIDKKVNAIKNQDETRFLKKIEHPAQGVADAFYDMSRLLFQEASDDSARVFANIALYLEPTLDDAHFLLGYISSRNEQYNDAISHYKNVSDKSPNHLEALRKAADLLEQNNDSKQAIKDLKNLADNYGDVSALIQIGDIYRREEQYQDAIKYYDMVADQYDQKIPHDIWHLLYSRGIAYEQMGDWEKAEADLLGALELEPDHPLVLNYIGYAWADQGLHLEKSLEYIRKAVQLKPNDGYITDSLGWVLYRQSKFEEALPHLERAVELLPYDPIINDHLGDAYWHVGRKREAKFQWKRAQNNAEDQDLISKINQKMEHGLEQHVTKNSQKQP